MAVNAPDFLSKRISETDDVDMVHYVGVNVLNRCARIVYLSPATCTLHMTSKADITVFWTTLSECADSDQRHPCMTSSRSHGRVVGSVETVKTAHTRSENKTALLEQIQRELHLPFLIDHTRT